MCRWRWRFFIDSIAPCVCARSGSEHTKRDRRICDSDLVFVASCMIVVAATTDDVPENRGAVAIRKLYDWISHLSIYDSRFEHIFHLYHIIILPLSWVHCKLFFAAKSVRIRVAVDDLLFLLLLLINAKGLHTHYYYYYNWRVEDSWIYQWRNNGCYGCWILCNCFSFAIFSLR